MMQFSKLSFHFRKQHSVIYTFYALFSYIKALKHQSYLLLSYEGLLQLLWMNVKVFMNLASKCHSTSKIGNSYISIDRSKPSAASNQCPWRRLIQKRLSQGPFLWWEEPWENVFFKWPQHRNIPFGQCICIVQSLYWFFFQQVNSCRRLSSQDSSVFP